MIRQMLLSVLPRRAGGGPKALFAPRFPFFMPIFAKYAFCTNYTRKKVLVYSNIHNKHGNCGGKTAENLEIPQRQHRMQGDFSALCRPFPPIAARWSFEILPI